MARTRLTCRPALRIFEAMKITGTKGTGPIAAAMNDAAEQASALLKALANRHRLLVVCQLLEGERSVGELAERLGIRDSTVSQHLALMRKDGLVTTRRDAQTIWYAIASPEARAVIETLYRLYCKPQKVCKPSAGRTGKLAAPRGGARPARAVNSRP